MMRRVLLAVALTAACVAAESDCTDFCQDPNGPKGTYLCCDITPGICAKDNQPNCRSPPGKKCEFDPDCPATHKCCDSRCPPYKVCRIAV